MRPPARAIAGNLVWSSDVGGGVWAVWRVAPFPYAHGDLADKLAIHAQLRALLMNLPGEAMLLSVCERLDGGDVVERMAEGVDLDRHPAWAETCAASAAWLGQVALRDRRSYLAVALPSADRGWRKVVGEVLADLESRYGIAPAAIGADELEARRRQAREIRLTLSRHIPLEDVSAAELCWLYSRAFRRGEREPSRDTGWEPSRRAKTGQRRVLAHLTDVMLREGGTPHDQERPRHRRYVRVDDGAAASYQTVLAISDMPHRFVFPHGGGEWLHQLEQMGFPVDWCVRLKALPNADAQGRVRRKQRELAGQVDQYDAEEAGAPPQLHGAIQAISEERNELAANPAESELQVTMLASLAASTLGELEEMAAALTATFEPADYGLARPTGGQVPLLRSMLPGATAAPVCRDYTQFMLARDLAAGAPFCGSEAGNPRGLLLGVSLDTGAQTPVLFDPAHGPKVNRSPSLAAVGRLGSGKSYFLKRLCMDTVARGGQVVTIDRSRRGEYVAFGNALPGSTQVVRLDAAAGVCLDPLRTFSGAERASVTLGFLSLLAGCAVQSEEGAALAEAVDSVAEREDARIGDVLAELEHIGGGRPVPDDAARALARRLGHHRRSADGQLVFGDAPPLRLDADFIVFWAPDLTLPDQRMLDRPDQLLPEQVFSQALLYLVAAVGRQVVFRDPTRFAAAHYDEAWALLASVHGQSLLAEGVRDGRKHNGAMWLASQHPNDLADGELADLLGARFVFDQSARAVPAALDLLGVPDHDEAALLLENGLDTGQCLYRDLQGRLGAIQVLPPALPRFAAAFDTTPTAISAGPIGSRELTGEDGGRAPGAGAFGELSGASDEGEPEPGPTGPDSGVATSPRRRSNRLAAALSEDSSA